MMGKDWSEAAASGSTPPSILAIIGGLILAPLLIGGAIGLLEPHLGMGFLLLAVPACVLAIPVVIALRWKVAFRLRNAVAVGLVMMFGIAVALEVNSAGDGLGSRLVPVFLMLGGVSIIYSAVAYGLIRAIDRVFAER